MAEHIDERERIFQKAEELGRVLSQTPEYAYLQAAQREIADDREATEALDKLRNLQETILAAVGRGEAPNEKQEGEFEALQESMQTSTRYQALISSQANFDKLMERVHLAIGNGIRKGEESRIIISS